MVLLPGKGHERHNHPESEEILYVLAGEGEQMLDDGGENSPDRGGRHDLRAHRHVPSTVNTGWQPLPCSRSTTREAPKRRCASCRTSAGRRADWAARVVSPTVLLIGTLDTKGDEYAFLRDRLQEAGVDVLLADAGTLDPPTIEPDITARSWRRPEGPIWPRWPRHAIAARQ